MAAIAACCLAVCAAPAMAHADGPAGTPAAPRETVPPAGSGPALGARLVDDLADGRLDDWSLADAALVASGVGAEGELEAYRARLGDLVGAVTARVSRNASPARRARRLLTELHRVALRRYEAGTDRFTDLIDKGVYNCVSASLLYIIAAREVGLQPAAVETPLHVFVMLQAGGRSIDIETTMPDGFDVRHDLAQFRAFVLANKYVTPEELAQRGLETVFNEFNNLTRPVAPERAVAFLYHNAGIRALQSGDASTAARDLVDAARIYPKLGYRSDDLRRTLAWSVRELYDAGDYLGAYSTAEISMRLFPDRTTVKERFTAVAARVVEQAAEGGDLDAASDYEARSMALVKESRDADDALRKFEAHTAPVIARAALLAHDWPAALRRAERFREVAPDPVEGERFLAWVRGRIEEGAGAAGAVAAAGGLDQKMRAALVDVPDGQDPREYAAIVRAIAALAERGRYDEALAVGRVQRSLRTDAADHGGAGAGTGLEELLRTVAARQVAGLLRDRRWQDAGRAVESALARWPGDAQLVTLYHHAQAMKSQDPWRLGAWPESVRTKGAPVDAAAHAGTGAEAPRADAPIVTGGAGIVEATAPSEISPDVADPSGPRR